MQQSASLFIVILCVIMFSKVQMSFGQETIQDQFTQFQENETSTWEAYRMIKEPKLSEFWRIVSDTLAVREGKINSARAKVGALQMELDSLNVQLSNTKVSLLESESLNDKISFVGIPMVKTMYNIMVWLIIALLVGGAVTLYFMYVRSNSITKKMQKAYSNLEGEYTEHKNLARENQVKLKRELQTALNTIHDNRINL
ncbi:MAG: hypothetical protein JXR07_00580 [Reichenbachiella sp.]